MEKIIVILGITALLFSAVGFYRLVYFLSIGYALSVLGFAVVSLVYFQPQVTWFSFLHLAGLALWGGRLSFFLIRRELQNSYQKEKQEIQENYGNAKFPLKVLIWIAVSGLYVLMFTPALYHLTGGTLTNPVLQGTRLLGLGILYGGILLEAIADHQKSVFKNSHPHTFCNTGLYSRVRCPNYLGEMLFWVGSWITAIGFYRTPWQWILSTFGLICILLIMLGSTKRLEKTQNERYGHTLEYKTYSQTVPILIPNVPIYTLQDKNFLLE